MEKKNAPLYAGFIAIAIVVLGAIFAIWMLGVNARMIEEIREIKDQIVAERIAMEVATSLVVESKTELVDAVATYRESMVKWERKDE